MHSTESVSGLSQASLGQRAQGQSALSVQGGQSMQDTVRPSPGGKGVKAPDLSGHTILIVEDIEVNRIALLGLLEDTGALVHEAVNGVEAVERFTHSPEGYYSFIFMDLLMPEMNGHDAARAIRRSERGDALHTPIVAISASTSLDDIEASLAAGMDAHLPKPVDRRTVFGILKERLL